MCWKEKTQWQSVANEPRKEHVLRPSFLDKVYYIIFFLMVICNSLLLLKSLPINLMLIVLPLQACMIGNTHICLFVYMQIISHDTLR